MLSREPFHLEETEVLDETNISSRLVIHNDDVNTFDWVAQSLVEICKHNWEQAEQCAYIIHHKGKYAVKTGSKDKLRAMKNAILDRGINATLE